VPQVQVVPSLANFVIFKTPVAAERLVDLMARQGVLIRNVSSYPKLEGYVRVNAGQKAENHAFVLALEGVLKRELDNR
jgi:histidinol-phosphate aminotransferase